MDKRESVEYDVVIAGAGPAGLSAAIRLKQLAAAKGKSVAVVVVEKGAEPGAHILSGALLDTRPLGALLPDWRSMEAPIRQPVTRETLLFLGRSSSWRVPRMWMPKCSLNHGHHVVSLGALTRWLARQAEALGVEIFPGFAASEVLYGDAGQVVGVATGNVGVDKSGRPGPNFQMGMALLGKYTLLAEGSRGHLGRQIIEQFNLAQDRDPQTYGIGIKELWEVDPSIHQPGHVLHTAGWPMDSWTYGGGFLYQMADRKMAVGFITGLNYRNPYLSPFEEFQRWKTHPDIRKFFGHDHAPARRMAYGARTLTAGGLLALPKLVFPGGALVGCEAGFLDPGRMKGVHTAMQSGMLAAQAAWEALEEGRAHDELLAYTEAFDRNWLKVELEETRNFKSWFKFGLHVGTAMNGLEQLGFSGRVPWTIHRGQPDHMALQPAANAQPVPYPAPDGRLTFDRPSSVFLSNTHHEENQPSHLTLKDANVPVQVNWNRYAGPEARYCPAGVYEFVRDENDQVRLQINAANCIHCKTCDIKDPTQNIVWVAPEGGGGPNYGEM